MEQDALFYDDFRGAIRHLIGALGGPKGVGHILRPTFSVKRAEAWIHDCLNPIRPESRAIKDFQRQRTKNLIERFAPRPGTLLPVVPTSRSSRRGASLDGNYILDSHSGISGL